MAYWGEAISRLRNPHAEPTTPTDLKAGWASLQKAKSTAAATAWEPGAHQAPTATSHAPSVKAAVQREAKRREPREARRIACTGEPASSIIEVSPLAMSSERGT